jgi:hypothetical protein
MYATPEPPFPPTLMTAWETVPVVPLPGVMPPPPPWPLFAAADPAGTIVVH